MQQPHLIPHKLGHHPNPHGYTHGQLFHLRATVSVHEQPHQTTRICSLAALPPLRVVSIYLTHLPLMGNPISSGASPRQPWAILIGAQAAPTRVRGPGNSVCIQADRYRSGQASGQQVQVRAAGAGSGSLGRQKQIQAARKLSWAADLELQAVERN